MDVKSTALHPSSIAHRPSSITDPKDWDRTLLSANNPSLLQSWRWGEFKGSSSWTPRRLEVEDINSQFTASICAQVLFRNLPGLPISIAYIPRGPVYTLGSADNDQLETAFWKTVHKEARKQGAIFLKVEPNVVLTHHNHPSINQTQTTPDSQTKSSIDRKMASMGFHPAGRLQPARTIVLDVNRAEDDLLKAMKPKTRYNIRLAERRGVQTRPAQNLNDLRAFYSLLQTTGARDQFGIHTFQYYERLWEVFGPDANNSLLVLLAEHPDEQEREARPIAGVLALKFGAETIYMYGASDNRGREHMPTYLLQWEAIKWARRQGCSIYDFWGIPDPPAEDTPESDVSPTNTRSGLRGVYWFKQGFGGREVEYPGAYDYAYNPVLYKVWMRWRGVDLG